VRKRLYDHIVSGTSKRTGCCFCEKENNKSLYKKCAGCKVATYCSRECQAKDWKRHKDNCMTLGANSTADIAINKLDNAFSTKLAISAVHRHLPEINTAILSNPVIKSLHKMKRGVRFDFCQVPPMLEIILVDDLVRDAEAKRDHFLILSHRATREQVYRADGQLALLQIEMHEGEGAAIKFALAQSNTVYQFPPAFRKDTTNPCAPRMNWQDKNGRVLDALWDDTDEIIYRMKLQKDDRWISGSGSTAKSTFKRLEELLSELVSDGRAEFGPQTSPLNGGLPFNLLSFLQNGLGISH